MPISEDLPTPSLIFVAAGRDFTLSDVLLAARARGDLDLIEREAAGALACARYAEEEGFELDEDAVQAASDEYRYGKDLVTVEDTERWLHERGLTLEDFGAYFERWHWHGRFAGDAAELAREYPPSPDDLEAALRHDILLGPHLAPLARALAWRVAARLEQAPGSLLAPVLEPALPALERAYEEERQRTLTPEACARTMAARHQALLRFALERAAFASAEAAGEALLCVREDGEALQDVAERASGRFDAVTVFADALPEAVQQRCLSARPGEVLLPVEEEGAHVVIRLAAKVEPDLGDAEVRVRVEQWLLEARFSQLTRTHIRWAFKEFE